MGMMNFIVDDKLEERFRKEVARRFGYKKGNIIKALEEAIEDWIRKKKEKTG